MKKRGDIATYAPPSISEVIDRMVYELSAADDKRFARFWNYTPIPKLIPWLSSRKQVKVMIGANKSTKTTMGIFEAIMVFTGIVPPGVRAIYPHQIPINRPRHVRVILQDYSKHWPETIQPLLLDEDKWGMLPRAWAQNYDPLEHIFYGPDGSWLSIMSVDPKMKTDPNELRGPLVDHTYIDELSTRVAFTESLTRNATLPDGPRTVTLGFCPQEGYDWTYDDFYVRAYSRLTHDRLPEDEQPRNMEIVRVEMHDNPSISAEAINQYIDTLKAHEVAYRVRGIYTSRANDPYFDIETLTKWETYQKWTAGVPCIVHKKKVDIEDGIFEGVIVPLQGEPDEENYNIWHLWSIPKNGHHYLMTMDTAEGNPKSDFQVADIWDCTDLLRIEQVGQFRKRTIKPGDFVELCLCMANCFGDCLVCYEVNNTSGGTVRDRSRNYSNLYRRAGRKTEIVNETDLLGWYTDQWSKPTALEEAFSLMRDWQRLTEPWCGIRSRHTLIEMMGYEEKIDRDVNGNSRRTWAPRQGCNDDTITTFYVMSYIVRLENHLLTPAKLRDITAPDAELSPLEREAREKNREKNAERIPLRKQPSLRQLSVKRGSLNNARTGRS